MATTFSSNLLRTSPDLLGTEKLCTRCNEWWPADLEFFYSQPGRAANLSHCCKACYREWFAARKAKQQQEAAA